MGRTIKTTEDRRGQIIDAAMQVFARKGFAQATIQDIAHQAGITSGLIYHYFESKEDVLTQIIARFSATRVIRALPPETLALPVRPLLQALAEQTLAIVEDEKYVQLIRIYLPEIIHNPETGATGVGDMQEAARFIEDILRLRVENGEILPADIHLLVQVFLSSLIGFVLRRQVFHDPTVLQYSQAQIADSIANAVFEEQR